MSKLYRGRPEETGNTPSRRLFLKRTAEAGLATVAGIALLPSVSLAGKGSTTPPVPQGTGQTPSPDTKGKTQDLDILNFALLLERVEAAFYNQNATKPYLTGGDIKKGPTSLAATLSGAEETPAVSVPGAGTATFTLSEDQTQLAYQVQASNLTGEATAMHLHRGARGVMGDVVYPLNTPLNGQASGSVAVQAADVTGLLNGDFYLNIHTAAYPAGEIRGQLAVVQSTTPTGTENTLLNLVTEIRDHENAHVALLEQSLGTNAAPRPTFQNLDAPTLQQFLTMAQMFEDVGVSAYLGQLPLIQDANALGTAAAILAVEARHAGGLRAYRKTVSTGIGGDPNVTLTEDKEALNRTRTRQQVQTLIQPYLAATTTTP